VECFGEDSERRVTMIEEEGVQLKKTPRPSAKGQMS
jgi:hypothetical protein